MKKILLLITLISIDLTAQVGINTENPQGVFNIDGRADAITTNPKTGIPTPLQLSDDVVVTSDGSVGIGTLPNLYSQLDIQSTNKGILIPRVTLLSNTYDLDADKDQDISNQPNGLLVYNAGGNLALGYYFWNGTEWRTFESKTTKTANATLSCGESFLDPEQVISGGVPIITGTYLRIPYTLGNGGLYNSATLTSTGNPNVKAIISNGQFEEGSGVIAFALTGIPTNNQSSPNGIEFDLTPFYTANPSITAGCNIVKVGQELRADIKSVAVQDYLKYTNDSNVPGYSTNITTPDGKFSIRVFIHANGNNFGTDGDTGMNLQIRNNTTSDLSIAGQYNWQWGGTGGNGSNLLGLQPGRWSGDNSWDGTNQTQVAWAGFLDGNATGNSCSTPGTSKTNNCKQYTHWGNSGVYAGGRPERRTYSWAVNESGSKTSYILTFSSFSNAPATSPNTTTCPNGICLSTQAFMKIEQITAP